MKLNIQSISENLSETILSELNKSLGFKIRGLKYANFQVLWETKYGYPRVLLEVGFLFISEEAEHSKLRQHE